MIGISVGKEGEGLLGESERVFGGSTTRSIGGIYDMRRQHYSYVTEPQKTWKSRLHENRKYL